jgi:hypothetical protein
LDAAVVRRLETLGFRIRLAVSLSSPVTARQMNPESVSASILESSPIINGITCDGEDSWIIDGYLWRISQVVWNGY